MNWKTFWGKYPVRDNELDFFQQVGKTKYGKAISERQFEILINDVNKKLELTSDDIVLDLCCGNGLITKLIAKKVSKVVGIDYSKPLIEKATKFNKLPNIDYLLFDAKELSQLKGQFKKYFTKVLCYEALAFFNEREFFHLLDVLKECSKPKSLFYFASILDKKKKFNFFNTFKQKLIYLKVLITGRDFGLGKWWNINKVKKIAEAKGFECIIYKQNEELHTAHFRTDVLLKVN